MNKVLGGLLLFAAAVLGYEATNLFGESTGSTIIAVGMLVIAVDLFMTVVFKKPLLRPGPLAKQGHKNLSDKDGIL